MASEQKTHIPQAAHYMQLLDVAQGKAGAAAYCRFVAGVSRLARPLEQIRDEKAREWGFAWVEACREGDASGVAFAHATYQQITGQGNNNGRAREYAERAQAAGWLLVVHRGVKRHATLYAIGDFTGGSTVGVFPQPECGKLECGGANANETATISGDVENQNKVADFPNKVADLPEWGGGFTNEHATYLEPYQELTRGGRKSGGVENPTAASAGELCGRCGSPLARYTEGRLLCRQCGAVFTETEGNE